MDLKDSTFAAFLFVSCGSAQATPTGHHRIALGHRELAGKWRGGELQRRRTDGRKEPCSDFSRKRPEPSRRSPVAAAAEYGEEGVGKEGRAIKRRRKMGRGAICVKMGAEFGVFSKCSR